MKDLSDLSITLHTGRVLIGKSIDIAAPPFFILKAETHVYIIQGFWLIRITKYKEKYFLT